MHRWKKLPPKLALGALLGLPICSPVLAEDILGKRISFRTQYATTTIRVLNDGHLLITGSNDDCKSASGEIGGEAFIGRTFSNDFTCSSQGQVQKQRLRATASFNNNVLRITNDWTQTIGGRTYNSRQDYVLTITGGTCSGTFIGQRVSDCTVQ